MKKLLTLGMLMAAFLIIGLTACKTDAEEELPGNWIKQGELWEGNYNPPFGDGKLTVDGL